MFFEQPKSIRSRYNGFTPIRECEVREYTFPECLDTLGVSRHIIEHRQTRLRVADISASYGVAVSTFLVRRDNQNEYHTIFDNGVIITQSDRSSKVNTFMIARPQQIKEYWLGMSKSFPTDLNYLLEIAKEQQHLSWK